MKKCIVFFILCITSINLYSQDKDSLLLFLDKSHEENKEKTVSTSLLPASMVFTQSLLWDKNGLMRITGLSPLTEKNREIELQIRRGMLLSHQVLGYITLAGMIAQGIIGQMLFNGNYDVKKVHEMIAIGVNVSYYTTAALSLFAPPPLFTEKTTGFNSSTLHKYLGILHFTAMVAANILSNWATYSQIKPIHQAVAYTAFAAFALSMVVMIIEF